MVLLTWCFMYRLLLICLGLSIPLSMRTTVMEFSIQGEVSPFLTEYLYASDLILGALLALYVVNNAMRYIALLSTWWFQILLVIWCFGVWTSSYPLLAFFFGLRIAGFVFLGMILWKHQSIYPVIYGFIIGMCLQGGIAGYQVLSQSSLNVPLIIEPTLGSDIAGIAKIDIAGNTFVRAHGTFPHANILGFASFLLLMMVHISYISRELWKWFLIAAICIMSFFDHFFLSFTQGMMLAWLAIVLTVYQIDIRFPRKIVQGMSLLAVLLIISSGSFVVIGLTGLWLITRLLPHQWTSQMIPRTKAHVGLGILLIGLSSIGSIHLFSFLATAQNRLFFLVQSWHILQEHPWGVGWGQFVRGLDPQAFEVWQYQPVHNIFLLILVEGGWVFGSLGLLLILYWLYSCIYVSYQN